VHSCMGVTERPPVWRHDRYVVITVTGKRLAPGCKINGCELQDVVNAGSCLIIRLLITTAKSGWHRTVKLIASEDAFVTISVPAMLVPALTLYRASTTRSMMWGAAGISPRDVTGAAVVVVATAVGLEEAVGVWLQEAKARTAPATTATFSHAPPKVSIPPPSLLSTRYPQVSHSCLKVSSSSPFGLSSEQTAQCTVPLHSLVVPRATTGLAGMSGSVVAASRTRRQSVRLCAWRTRDTMSSNRDHIVSGWVKAKGRNTGWVSMRVRRSVSAVTVADRRFD
jgi:hypothetical protein